MVGIFALWLPIVLAAVLVFVASSVIHMFLGYHKGDYRKPPNEDALMDALRSAGVPPGDYMFPCAEGDPAIMKSEEFKAKVAKGPVGIMTIMPPNAMGAMGPQLTQWFVYCLVVSLFTAYVGELALDAGAGYMAVFRVTGTAAFGFYALAAWPHSIWYKLAWGTTLKGTFDAFVYGMLTAGVFGWLWP